MNANSLPIISNSTASASACGGCAVKSEGNCTSHLTGAADIIVQGFVEAGKMFDRANPKHIAFVTSVLAEDIRDNHDRHVSYEVPKEPKLQDWFYGLINQRVAQALGATAPSR